jgi:hypothetical protein
MRGFKNSCFFASPALAGVSGQKAAPGRASAWLVKAKPCLTTDAGRLTDFFSVLAGKKSQQVGLAR